jgi:hypothetical protein
MNTAQHRIQLRYSAESDRPPETFEYGDTRYTFVGESQYIDLLPAYNPYRIQRQYIYRDDEGGLFEVYIYFYGKFENGNRYAVIDAMREAQGAA